MTTPSALKIVGQRLTNPGGDNLSVELSQIQVDSFVGLYRSGNTLALTANPEFSAGALRAYVAPQVVTSANVSNASSADVIVDLATPGDGYFQFHVSVLLKRQFGTYRRVSAMIDGLRLSGTLTVQGSQVMLPAGNGTGITLTLAAGTAGDAGKLKVTIANASGENASGRVYAGWLWEAPIS